MPIAFALAASRRTVSSRVAAPIPVARRLGTTAAALALLLVSGCASLHEWCHNGHEVGPNYRRPCAPVAKQWIDAGDQRLRNETVDHADWWTVFHDPTLTGLIHEAYDQNLTVRVAGFRILQARAQLAISVGNIFPQTQQAYADYMRDLNSRETATTAFAPRRYNNFDAGFNLAWELDFWGRFRRAIESQDALLDASIENYDDVLVTLLSDVATNYVEIRTLQRRVELAAANVQAIRGSYDIADSRFKNGAGNEIDLEQAQTNLSQTEALIPALEQELRRANNRLCILLGRYPEDLTKTWPAASIPTPPVEVAVGIPGDLMRRRPDVRRAERELAAQSAQIGVAESELYPHISIIGTIGVEAANFKDLFNSQASYGSIGPSLRWNILNYGRIQNNVVVQQGRFQELAANYQNVVLNANEEAENAIVGFLKSQQRTRALNTGVNAAQKANDLVLELYKSGRADFNRVFNIQSFLVTQQDSATQAAGDVDLNLIDLYRSLGGGWQIRFEQGDGTTWCERGCSANCCCPDDYCPKGCPVRPTGTRCDQLQCGPPPVGCCEKPDRGCIIVH
ncbi:MAG TPA: efflux transporter outer membrane subunit [Pirellulales bacterium]|jgi:NodT family efflux transporter outer membrane factor (OMF) lipoprotein|nr:efflux transporter outer membrane subunit [Pirellulales bacterium]